MIQQGDDTLMDKDCKGVETAHKEGERWLSERGTQGRIKVAAALLRAATRMFGQLRGGLRDFHLHSFASE